MAKKNRFGLSRDIPEDVKREVRQRDGFGCVVCGKAIYEYEHFEPEFKDATCHQAGGIILLCDAHHRKKGSFLSRETIARHAQTPAAKRSGFSFEVFDVGFDHPTVVFGGLVCTRVERIIEIDGHEVFSVRPPEQPGGPFRINALITDSGGDEILRIVDNEWRVPSENWDVTVIKNRITVRRALGEVALVLRTEPPRRIVVEQLRLSYRGTEVSVEEDGPIRVETKRGLSLRSDKIEVGDAKAALQISDGHLALGVGAAFTLITSGTFGFSAGKRYDPQMIFWSATLWRKPSASPGAQFLSFTRIGR